MRSSCPIPCPPGSDPVPRRTRIRTRTRTGIRIRTRTRRAPRRTRRRGPRVGPPRAAADGRRTGFGRSSRPQPGSSSAGPRGGSRGRSSDGRGASAPGSRRIRRRTWTPCRLLRGPPSCVSSVPRPSDNHDNVTLRKTPRPIFRILISGIFRAPHRERRGARVGCDPAAGRDPAREDVHSRFIVRGLGSASTEAPGAGEEEAPTATRLGTHHTPGNRDVTEELPTGKRGRGSPYRREWDRPP